MGWVALAIMVDSQGWELDNDSALKNEIEATIRLIC